MTLVDLPEASAPWEDIWSIARASLPFINQPSAGQVANDACDHFRKTGGYANDLHTLRTCLFFEWWRFRHLEHHPGGESEVYVRGIVQAMRDCLANKSDNAAH